MAVFSGPRYGGGKTPAEVKALRAEAEKHNQMFMANLKIAMAALPKYVLGTYAATLLDTAVRETKHDSGRFAANWNLALDGQLPTVMPDPLKYGQSGEKYGSIGFKNDKRFRIAVLMAKRTYYGYKKGSGGYMALTKGRLANALYAHGGGVPGSDMSGSAGRILLYNPFMKPDQRKASWWPKTHPDSLKRKGKGYAYYAMSKGADRALAGPLGSGVIQRYVSQLQREIRKATAAKRIIDPRGITII